MARDASITLHFGDGEHVFRLRLGQLLELQDKINRPRVQLLMAAGMDRISTRELMGPRSMLELLGRGDLWPHEIRELLRIGLVGGGMKLPAVEMLLQQHLPNYGQAELSVIAGLVLDAAMSGDEATPVGKDAAAAEAAAEAQMTTTSTPAPSMATESSSASTRAPSTTSPLSNTPG